MDDKKVIISKIEDKIKRFNDSEILDYSPFLSLDEQSLIKRNVEYNHNILYGGYLDAERKKVIFLPTYYELDDVISDIFKVVKVTIPKQEKVKLGHRDYLGAVLSLGIKREKIGDIIVYDYGAEIICDSDIAEFLKDELRTIGRATVSSEVISIKELNLEEIKFEEVRLSVPSARLDNFLVEVFHISRKIAKEGIEKGLAFVDGLKVLKPDYKLSENQKVVLRGYGKAIFLYIDGESRKGNKYIVVKKYV